MNSYKELIVWQKSVELVVEIYRITKIFPTEEKFSIETQIIISKKLNFVKIDEWARIDGLLNEVLRMLFRYRQSLLSPIG